MPPSGRYYIGLMSGTSMDGVDGVLVEFASAQGRPAGAQPGPATTPAGAGASEAAPAPRLEPRVLAQASLALPADLRGELLALNSPGQDELGRSSLAARQLAQQYAQVVAALLYRGEVEPAEVAAIGAHGQTVRHRPDLGYTIQLNAPALLAELAGIPVVADFRSRDVAAGGQGAPLVPAFHAALFGADRPVGVLNLGGIANVTLLQPGREPVGFDTGPANVLLDLWCARHLGRPYDESGRWAASGSASAALLDALVAGEPWFALPPPKSTGRDLFNAGWLDARLARHGAGLAPADVQATLQRLTARTVAEAVAAAGLAVEEILVCGGGAENAGLMRDLADCLGLPVRPTDRAGAPARLVEAMAFAWLAWAHVHRVPAGLPSVTGARGPRVLGAWYPA